MRNPKPQEWKTEDYSQKKIADYKAFNFVDGEGDWRFELAKRNLNLQFRGSSNQRIIDVPKSLAAGKAVIWEKCHDAETSYEQIKKSI